jgi:hypothetical protein
VIGSLPAVANARRPTMDFHVPKHGKPRFTQGSAGLRSVFMREGPRKEGLAASERMVGILDTLLVPSDTRGIILLCGFVGCAAFGLGAILTPPSDPIGWAYLGGAVLGYVYIQTRGLTTFLWLLVAAGGVSVALAGAASGWVVFGLGTVLALVSLLPLPAQYRGETDSTPATELAPSPISTPMGPLNGQSSTFPEVSAPSPGGPSGPLVIRSIGAFKLISSAGDLTSNLEAKSVVSFIWKLLLAREVRGDPHLVRDALAEELSPRMSDAGRRERVRKQIYDLQNDIRPELASVVRTDRTHVWLDVTDADFDAAALQTLCLRVASPGSLIDRTLAQQVRQMLTATSGEFLAGFEDLQYRVTRGNGTAGEVVAGAREVIANQRADLTRALADYLDATGQVHEAIPHLKVALELLPERQDLARLLVAAYMQTGQPARASEVRTALDPNQEGRS